MSVSTRSPADLPLRAVVPGAPTAQVPAGRRPRRPRGLRRTITSAFAVGGLLLAGVMSLGTYVTAREYLVDQRENVARQQAFADASFVRNGMLTETRPVSEVLGAASPPADSRIFVRRDDEWFSTSLTQTRDVVPVEVREAVAEGRPVSQWGADEEGVFVAIGVPIPAVGADFFEVSRTPELQRTLNTLAWVLGTFAALTVLGAALLGRWAAGRVVAPLDDIAGTAARVAGGDLSNRLPTTEDPDLVTLVGSFNAMVDALTERIERDARFTADVSHELRSPLTTLTTSVQLLERRRGELPEATRELVDLLGSEVERFRQVVDDLLELGRLDAEKHGAARDRQVVDARDLVREALATSGRSDDLLAAAPDQPAPVDVDKLQLARALVNLFDNADRHGSGVTAVTVRCPGGTDPHVQVVVDDAGPGVPPHDRERIFERFVRGGSRGSLPGTGLGLSLVAETARAHGGSVHVEDVPGGGARFVLQLPVAAEERP